MDNFWDYKLLDNSFRDWGITIGIIILAILVLRIVRTVFLGRLKAIAAKTSNNIDDFFVELIQFNVMPLLYIIAIYIGLKNITFPQVGNKVMYVAIMVVITFFVVKFITSFIAFAFKQALSRKEPDATREKQAKGILIILQIIIWLIGILFLVDNLGYDITTLVAGLGIGGIAIALAAQTILGDLFSYMVIFFDKPFEIGDFIIVGDKKGTVEYIGIKTTRLKSLGGEQLIFSNTDLTNSRVHNYKRMEERRIVFTFGVIYSTPSEKLQKITAMVKDIITGIEDVRFDRVHFKEFGDFSLNFEAVYYVLSPDFNVYMDKQQIINLAMFEQFEKEEIEFAFPTQTLYVNRVNKDESSKA